MLRKRREDCKPQPDPLVVPDYTEADIQALRAVANGYATEEQQKRATEFLINDLCDTYGCAARRTEHETYLALGRQRAGQIFVYLLNDAPTETPAAKIAARYLGVNKDG